MDNDFVWFTEIQCFEQDWPVNGMEAGDIASNKMDDFTIISPEGFKERIVCGLVS